MALDGEAFDDVAAWVSFSGMLSGTPLIGWLRSQPLRWWGIRLWLWWRGHGSQALRDLEYRGAAPDHSGFAGNTRIVHVCAFPLRHHLAHPWAGRGYDRLAPLGPNDGGGVLLRDCLDWPGIVCPIWGVDHYLDPAWDLSPLLTGCVSAALRE